MNDSKTSNDSGKSKHKKKVSFSIFEISTFDELAKLRKMREEELDYFVKNKKKTNQYLNNINQRNKILSLSNQELLSLDNNTNINENNLAKKNMNIPKPIKREGSLEDSNNNILINIGSKNKNNLNVNKVTLFSDEEDYIKNNELYPSIPQFNSIEKNEIINDINILKPDNNNINNNNLVNNIEEELSNIKNKKNNISNHIEIEENLDDNNKNKMDVVSLFNVLEKIFNISETLKFYYIQEFFKKLKNYIEYKFDLYLEYLSTDPSFNEEVQKKSELIYRKIYYNYLINKIKNDAKKNRIYQEHKEKAQKYKEYLNYKYKVYAFNNLYNFGKKQKEWIKSIQLGFKKKLIWDCVDSLKLYANYKKIKMYLKTRKKKQIFDVLKNNKQLSIKLLKTGKKLSLIFEYRHFFNNCRKKILAKKGIEINDKLVNEFRNQNLMKNIFGLIKLNCEIKKAKKYKYENVLTKNKIKSDFINLKITRKETVKFNNGSTLLRIQNKINVI